MHFFNPVPVMTLVEIVRGLAQAMKRSPPFKALALNWARSRSPSTDAPGFVSNRVLMPLNQ